jgi:hypothetical protein
MYLPHWTRGTAMQSNSVKGGNLSNKATRRKQKKCLNLGLHTEFLENRMMMSITVTSAFDGAIQSQQTTLIGAILTADSGSGTTIILPANTTFTLSGSGYTAPLTGNGSVNTGITLLPGINQPITIEGNGSTITLAPGAAGRFFSVNSNLTLENINLIGGTQQGGDGGGGFTGGGGGAGLGGAIFVNGTSATLTMNQASIGYSSATGGAGSYYDTVGGGLPGDEGGGGGGGLGGQGAHHSGSGDGIKGGGGGGPLSYTTTTSGTAGADGVGGTGGTGSGVSGTAGAFGGGGGGGAGGNYVNSNYQTAGAGGAGGFGGGGGGGGYSPGTGSPKGGAGGFGGGGGASGYGPNGGAGGPFGGIGGNGAANNQIGGGGAGLGGAVFNYQGTVNLNNVSLLNNSATGGGGYGTGSAAGGALFNYSGNLTLKNTTIANNSTTVSGGSGASGSAQGGGIYNYKATGLATPTVNLYNSVLTSDVTNSATGTTSANDILSGTAGTVTANGTNHNFISASAGTISGAAVLSGAAQLDFVGLFAGYLMAPPEPGSQLAAAGDPTTSLSVDETGATRSNTTPTIGAYEGALPSPFPLSTGSIIVSESSLGGLFAIDPSTGNRQTISAANVLGTGPALISPTALALDGNGNAYVAASDAVNNNEDQIIKIDLTTGNRTLFSGGSTGTGPAFNNISDIAYDSAAGTLLVTDSFGQAIFSVGTSTGNRTLLSDNTTPNGNNPLNIPTSITYNSNAGIVAGDQFFDSGTNDSGLLKVDSSSGARTVFSDDTHPNTANQIGEVEGIANNTDGSILLIDELSNPSAGVPTPPVLDSVATTGTPGARTLLATLPSVDSYNDGVAELGVAAGSSGIYVTQNGSAAFDNQVLHVSGSTVTELTGNDMASGPYFTTGLNIGIAVVPAGVAAAQFSVGTETVDPTTGTFSIPVTVTGTPGTTVSTFASGLSAPSSLAFDAAGNLYIANFAGGTIMQVTPGGAVNTFASGFISPSGLAFDASGNLYVADFGANTVSEVTPGGMVSTFATGFSSPFGLAFDAAGNLYVANQTSNTVSQVTPGGSVNTFASGFNSPEGLAFDAAGNLYVSNTSGNDVSQVTPGGVVSTFASGFSSPIGLSFDPAGNLYVANEGDNTISQVTPGGTISSFSSGFNLPTGIAFDASGDLYVANYGGDTVSDVNTRASVPFTLGGTAVSGIDYSGITSSPLLFGPGQTLAYITGTLISDPGSNKTLTITLGTPINANLGSPSVNTLTIVEPVAPAVTTNPANTTINSGGNTSLTSAATGSPAPTEQWQISTDGGATFSDISNGGVYSGATSATLTITGGTTALDGNMYQDVFTNTSGSDTTTAATLTVDSAPVIATNATSQTINAGGNTSFTASATGNPTPTVQWQVSTNGGSTFTNITNGGVYSGATTGTLSITGATASMDGYEYQAVYSNTLFGAGSPTTTTSTPATLTVDNAPSISTNPSNTTVNANDNTSLNAAATGNPSPTVQWQLSIDGGATFNNITNGGFYGGATTSTLSITAAQAFMNGYEYQAVYTNTLHNAGSPTTTTTTPATLTVDVAPSVTGNPIDQTINAGSNTTFNATATGTPTPTVQWQVSTNGGATFSNLSDTGVYSGTATNTMQVTGATAGMNTCKYRAVFSNTLFGAGSPSQSISTTATLTVDSAPVVAANPSNTTVNTGANTTISASITDGYPTPTNYQWQISTNNGSNWNNLTNTGPYTTVTTQTLHITAATTGMSGYQYRLVAGNSAFSNSATTTAATLTVDFAPSVNTNPINQTITPGGNTSFSAAASGNPTLTVQWQVSIDGGATFNNLTNGGIYGGATADTLTLTGATLAQNAYEYQAVFSNTLFGAGSPSTATTSPATLTVNASPVVGTNPTNMTINAGGNTSFTSSATGFPTPTEQWQVSTDGGATFNNITDGGVYSGSATATLSIAGGLASMNGYEYRDVFTNGNGSATTAPSTLNIDFAPTVTSNPTNGTINTGSNTTFTAAASGNPTPNVQWKVSTNAGATFNNLTNTGIYSGVTTGTLTLTGATSAQNGYEYLAVFSNTLFNAGAPSTATTTPATLTVDQAPAIASVTAQTFTVGQNGSFTIHTTGFPIAELSETGALPAGVTFVDNHDGTATLSGTPAAATGGTYHLTLGAANGVQTAASQSFTLTINQSPAVTSAASATLTVGQSGSYTMTSTGFPIAVMHKTGILPAGITFTDNNDGTATIAGTPGAGTGGIYNLTLTASNDVSPNATLPFTLTIDAAPVVITSPTSTTINAGGNVSFTSIANGYPVPTEQWQVSSDGGNTFTDVTDSDVYLGATSATLSITGGTAAMNGDEYRDVFTNGNGIANTNASTLTVDFAPTVTSNPTNEMVNSGGTASFTAAAAANPLASVQWQISTDGGATFTNLANTGMYTGVTTDTLTVAGATLQENGAEYRAVFSNTLPDAASPTTATTTPAMLNVGTPVITVSAYARLVSPTSNTGLLHVQAQQEGTDANLIYTWSIVSQPATLSSAAGNNPQAISAAPLALFAINGTNSAKNTPVTFLASGNYTLQVTASNGIQSVTSQVQVTTTVKPSVTRATTLVSGVQTIGDAKSITGFVVTFNGPMDPTTAQDVRGYRILQQSTAGRKLHFLQWALGTNPGNQTETRPYKIASAVYNPQTDTVTLTLATPMAVKNGVRLVQVMGTGTHAVLDSSATPIDGDANGKAGGTFNYRLNMSVSKSITYQTASGDTVRLSLRGPGEIVTLLPAGTKTPVVDLINTDSVTSILTGTLRKGRKGLGFAVLDQLNGTAQAQIRLGNEFKVNE